MRFFASNPIPQSPDSYSNSVLDIILTSQRYSNSISRIGSSPEDPILCGPPPPRPGDPILRCDPRPRSIVQMDNVETLAALSWLSYYGCPVLGVLSRQSFPGCPVVAAHSRLSCPVLAVLSWLSVAAVGEHILSTLPYSRHFWI
jgi:hypothetical protein